MTNFLNASHTSGLDASSTSFRTSWKVRDVPPRIKGRKIRDVTMSSAENKTNYSWHFHDIFIGIKNQHTDYLVICSRHLCLSGQVVLSDQHILSAINPDLQRFTKIVLKFKTQVLQVLNFRRICVNFWKSDKIGRHILG